MWDLSAQIISGRWVPHELSHKQFWSANCCESQFMDVIHAPTSFTLQNNKRCTEEQNCETYLQTALLLKMIALDLLCFGPLKKLIDLFSQFAELMKMKHQRSLACCSVATLIYVPG